MPLQTGRFLVPSAAIVALLAAAAPAPAAEVIVVDGDRAERVDDPLVPPRSESDLGREPASRRGVHAARRRRSSRGQRAVGRALRRALRAGRIDLARYDGYRRAYRRARFARRRIRGARGQQLGYVIGSLEGIALRRRLTASRMPVLFLQLKRNTQYWPGRPYPGAGDRITFRGSEILFQYFPGRGLQLHPLATFKKANLMQGACRGVVEAPCRRSGLARLLDEMSGLAVRRGRGWIAWEYLFHFGGGSPPWMSGMAQATGIVGLGRAAALLGRPDYVETARRALGAFEAPPPVGVRTRGYDGGTHYLQYSFAPRLYIFNAFLQALLGLRDFAKDTGDDRARNLYLEGEPEARREVPDSDVGDWSRYSYRGRESTREYHELLRELLQSMCIRRLGGLYCTYARRYRGYQTMPPAIGFTGPELATEEQLTRIRFTLSKLSAVELKVYKGERLAAQKLATFRRGTGSFLWRPRSPGLYTVMLGAKELRTGLGLKGRDSGEIEVENDPDA